MRGSIRAELRSLLRQGEFMLRRGLGFDHPRLLAESPNRLVVFVHGFLSHGSVWVPMREQICKKHPVEAIDFSYGFWEEFERVAVRLAQKIEKHAQGRPITLIGHSLGGLLARWVIQEGWVEGADRLITLATPHEGTRLAEWIPGPMAEAIRPGGAILRRLRALEGRLNRLECWVIVAERDRLIQPLASASALARAQVLTFPVGHNELLFDREVLAFIAQHVG
ncbi:MAG: putative lipase [Deltaproteobacteria bacterium]|nr:putative lipase [Sandaracinaceae bacterium]MCX7807193.1 putative lipase [Deltaproteobacteria bacterium]MDW8245888.1 alpha/beta fold hydrolase [Sandaracinaceae bacterium]